MTGLDLVWAVWGLWGMLSASVAPDLSLGWREWRLCFLGPAVLYGLLRFAAVVPLDPKGLLPTVGPD